MTSHLSSPSPLPTVPHKPITPRPSPHKSIQVLGSTNHCRRPSSRRRSAAPSHRGPYSHRTHPRTPFPTKPPCSSTSSSGAPPPPSPPPSASPPSLRPASAYRSVDLTSSALSASPFGLHPCRRSPPPSPRPHPASSSAGSTPTPSLSAVHSAPSTSPPPPSMTTPDARALLIRHLCRSPPPSPRPHPASSSVVSTPTLSLSAVHSPPSLAPPPTMIPDARALLIRLFGATLRLRILLRSRFRSRVRCTDDGLAFGPASSPPFVASDRSLSPSPPWDLRRCPDRDATSSASICDSALLLRSSPSSAQPHRRPGHQRRF